jgi:hypothetical protein
MIEVLRVALEENWEIPETPQPNGIIYSSGPNATAIALTIGGPHGSDGFAAPLEDFYAIWKEAVDLN